MDDITAAIASATFRLQDLRIVLRAERELGKPMAVSISGLKAEALKARANWDRINAAYKKFNDAAPAHAADVEGLASGIAEMQTDLEFATNLMGNSSPNDLLQGSDGLPEETPPATPLPAKPSPISIPTEPPLPTAAKPLNDHPAAALVLSVPARRWLR